MPHDVPPAHPSPTPPASPGPERPPMRIGYVLKMYPRFSETFILTEMLELEAQGMDLEVFSLRLPVDGRFHPDLARLRAPVEYLHPGTLRADQPWQSLHRFLAEVGEVPPAVLAELARHGAREAAQALDLAAAVRARGITHLHAHFGSTATSVARLAAALAGIGYTFTAHAKDIFHEEVEAEDLRAKLADARAVVTVSDFNLAHLRKTFGADAARVRRIYNGIALERFPVRADRDESAAAPRIVSVGRLVEKKGFDVLVEAARLLRERRIPVELEIAGAGPLAEPLSGRIAALGLDSCVRLLGPLPQDRVRELVAGATVFAAPCRVGEDGNRDGLPTVLLEAMALGTPCVSTPVTGIPEAIQDGGTGLLVPEDDAPALADALARLLADAPLRTRLAGAARERVETDFDAVRQAGAVGALFAELHAPERSVSAEAAPPVGAAARAGGAAGDAGRVAVVCTDAGIPVFGSKGASVHLQSVLQVLVDAGHDVHVITPRPGPLSGELAGRCTVHLLPEIGSGEAAVRERRARAADAQVAEILQDIGPDLVYERYALWGRTATAWAEAAGVPSILEVNSPLIPEQARHRELHAPEAAYEVARSAIRCARGIMCVSEAVAAWVREVAEDPALPLRVLPNGVDTDRIRPALLPREPGPFTVGFLGTLKPWHGLDVLLEAMARLPREECRLLVVGDGPLRAEVARAAAEAGIALELTGAVEAGEVSAHLQRMDVACAPYPAAEDHYFSPLKVFEYLAAGLPVVASTIGQIPDLLDHGRIGRLVPPGDAGALAEALLALWADPPLRADLGRAAREAALARHTWRSVVEGALATVGMELGGPRSTVRTVAAAAGGVR
ncbi:glycosyltransferase [Brachybacterium hainanense]|uniref:D-inositol 3-phosphate glycosyltransferase n=1 Tax=Brachybacterium hainanense TaxID=1541174 RepID=A0ABV6RCM1_9MICO